MKKIIISSKMLGRLNEENSINIAVQAKSNNLSSFSAAATDTNTQSDVQKARNAGDVDLTINGPKTNDSQPQQQINVAAGDTVANAIQTQGNNELISNGGSLKITGDGFGESKVYSKKAVEEARLAKIKMEGRVMTKKQLAESFESDDNLRERLNELPLHILFDAYSILGDVRELSEEPSIMTAIIRKYNEAEPRIQDAFRARLDRGTKKEVIDLDTDNI